MKLLKQHSSRQSAGLHARREGDINFRNANLVCYDFSLVFDRLPVVSLWKPGVPYPVHGRVLVEIQRPRSLHRKAVIQLNTKRNQHNQSKQPVHLKTETTQGTNFTQIVVISCRPLCKPFQLSGIATTLGEPNNLSEQLVYGCCSFSW